MASTTRWSALAEYRNSSQITVIRTLWSDTLERANVTGPTKFRGRVERVRASSYPRCPWAHKTQVTLYFLLIQESRHSSDNYLMTTRSLYKGWSIGRTAKPILCVVINRSSWFSSDFKLLSRFRSVSWGADRFVKAASYKKLVRGEWFWWGSYEIDVTTKNIVREGSFIISFFLFFFFFFCLPQVGPGAFRTLHESSVRVVAGFFPHQVLGEMKTMWETKGSNGVGCQTYNRWSQ